MTGQSALNAPCGAEVPRCLSETFHIIFQIFNLSLREVNKRLPGRWHKGPFKPPDLSFLCTVLCFYNLLFPLQFPAVKHRSFSACSLITSVNRFHRAAHAGADAAGHDLFD
jgi:hypothetical protein